MVSAIVLVEHEPQATEADEPVSKTDRNFRQEVPSRRNQGGEPRQKVSGRWSKAGGPR